MSIVEWLPDLPADWDVARLSYLCRIGTGELDTIDADPEGSVPFYIRSPHIQRATSATGAGEAVLTPGDGAVGEVFHHHRAGDFAAHQRVYVLDRFDRTNLLPRFFYWYFSSRFRMVTSGGTAKSTVESLRRPMFTSFPVALPPLVQQRRIADYLDRETATIDALIEKQRMLIGTLGERRRTMISEATTLGLRGGDDLIETSVPWVDRIPRRWQMMAARRIFALRREKSRPDAVHLTPSQKFGVLPQQEYMRLSGSRVVLNLTGADSMQAVEPGDFVIHLRSFEGGIEYSELAGKVSNAYTVLTPAKGVHAHFWRWMLKSQRYVEALRVTVDQLRDGQSIRYQDFAKVPLPVPPLDEQCEIADHLDRETAKIDALIAKAERFIELARERRAALITAAVTGQIEIPTED